jgi:hypothetical protein
MVNTDLTWTDCTILNANTSESEIIPCAALMSAKCVVWNEGGGLQWNNLKTCRLS